MSVYLVIYFGDRISGILGRYQIHYRSVGDLELLVLLSAEITGCLTTPYLAPIFYGRLSKSNSADKTNQQMKSVGFKTLPYLSLAYESPEFVEFKPMRCRTRECMFTLLFEHR